MGAFFKVLNSERTCGNMKKLPLFILLLYLISPVSGSLYALGEKIISLGGASGWDSALIRSGIDELPRLRTHPALVLSAGDSVRNSAGGRAVPDLSLSFDEGSPRLFRDSAGHYRVTVSPEMEAVDRQWAHTGSGSAFFSGIRAVNSAEPLLVEVASRDALFAPDNRIGDFTIEFWLYPFNMENGETIFSWTSSRPSAVRNTAEYSVQKIQCSASKNRLNWSFQDFFAAPDVSKYLDIHFSGDTPIVPRTWSHHLVRFDSGTGMIEYVVDGKAQAIKYAVLSGREGGEVYTPITGRGGCFSLGSRFTGLLDEFRIYSFCANLPSLQKYPRSGRMETRPIDLGEANSEIIKVQARGGRTVMGSQSGEFQEDGRFRFADDAEMQFFLRTSENPYSWDNSPWRVFTPGAELSGIRGRYVQLAVNFYPSAEGLNSPYLEDMRISYVPNGSPMPPSSFTAIAGDGGVQLRWKSSPSMDTEGYLVYYGTVKDDFFCEDAILGVSPIDAGKQNNLVIYGLKNGVLYYFRVAAYNKRNSGSFHAGEFSREVSARPLEGLGYF
jgi:hypothetical protein